MRLQRSEIESLFSQFEKLKVLIIGDVMLDKYVYGHVDRISPEAPVPVVMVEKIEGRPGGAANVAMNIKALGAMPFLVSVTGFDKDASEINELFEQNGISTKYMIEAPGRLTSTKTRVIGKNQQMIRLDHETTEDISGKVEASVLKMAGDIIEQENPDVVIFEDYNKGTLTQKIIEEIIAVCNKLNIPVAVDPKKKNFFSYKNCTLFKPNLREVRESLNLQIDDNSIPGIEIAGKQIRSALNNKISMITLGEHGIFIGSENENFHIPAHLRNIADVSGAGDTVISVAALCLAAKTSMQTLAELSNIAGGLVCEYSGVVPIAKEQLMKEI